MSGSTNLDPAPFDGGPALAMFVAQSGAALTSNATTGMHGGYRPDASLSRRRFHLADHVPAGESGFVQGPMTPAERYPNGTHVEPWRKDNSLALASRKGRLS